MGLWPQRRTYHDEDDFRKVVVFVADKPIIKPKPVPVPLSGRYEGPVEPGMVFNYGPARNMLTSG